MQCSEPFIDIIRRQSRKCYLFGRPKNRGGGQVLVNLSGIICQPNPPSPHLSLNWLEQGQGSVTNYVYKTRQVGGQKMSTFCQRSYHRKCQHRGVGVSKKAKILSKQFVNAPQQHAFQHDICFLQASTGRLKLQLRNPFIT